MSDAARALVLALAGPVLALAGHAGPAATWLPLLRRGWFPALAGVGAPGHVALTFDDGPDPSSTPRFLDALDALGVRATFFVLGEAADRHRRLTAEIAERGHELAVHGWTHDRPWKPSVRGQTRELRRAAGVIGDLTGTAPRWYRPPYGILTGDRVIAAARAGLRPVLWSAWGRDWEPTATADSVRALVTRDLPVNGLGAAEPADRDLLGRGPGSRGLAARGPRGGGTVLLHDTDRSGQQGWRAALDALPGIVADCRDRGWAAGPLGEHWTRPGQAPA